MRYLCFALTVALFTVEWMKFIVYGPSIAAALTIIATVAAFLSVGR